MDNIIYKNTTYEYDEDLLGRKFDEMCTKWSLDEMKLKMVLLGGFFEQYFMSIHNELVRSVCEEIFMSDPMRIVSGLQEVEVDDCNSSLGAIFSEWSSDQDEGSEGGTGLIDTISLHLDEVHVCAGLEREDPNGRLFENTTPSTTQTDYTGLPYIPITTCHQQDANNLEIKSYDDLSMLAGQFFNGIGAVATGHFKMDSVVKYGKFTTNTHGGEIIVEQEIPNPSNDFTFNVLFTRPGDFILTFEFKTEEGSVFQKIVKVNVKNNLNLGVEFKKLVSKVKPMNTQPNPWSPIPVSHRYMFARTRELHYKTYPIGDDYQIDLTGDYKYSQFVPIKNTSESILQDAPHKSEILNIQWSENVQNNIDRALEYYKDYYTRYGSNDEIGWVQVLSPLRGEHIKYSENLGGNHWYSNVFIPELHDLQPITKGDIDQSYPIVCTPTISIENGKNTKKVPYSYYIDAQLGRGPVWEFYSVSRAKNVAQLRYNIEEPMMLWEYSDKLPGGYYYVTWKCNYDETTQKGISYKTKTNFRIK